MGGATQFSDMTLEEFQALPIRGLNAGLYADLPNLGKHEIDTTVDSTAEVDWVSKGAVTPVKDQGQCGSCWAFSTTGGLEGAWELSSGNLVSMSEQQFVDCSKQNSGCNGGLMDTAFSWAKSKNVATESSYAYTARDGTCKSSFTTGIPKGGVTGYKSVGSLFSKATVAKLESAIDLNLVSIAIEADQASFQHYTGGILASGCGTNLDHGVLAVGYNTAEGYWIVKNSWGTTWGESGYIRLGISSSSRHGICGLLQQPSYPIAGDSPGPGPSPGPTPTPS